MGAVIEVRADFNGPSLRDLAKRSRGEAQARRLIALAEIYDGRRRSDVARLRASDCRSSAIGWCGSTRKGPNGLINRKG